MIRQGKRYGKNVSFQLRITQDYLDALRALSEKTSKPISVLMNEMFDEYFAEFVRKQA